MKLLINYLMGALFLAILCQSKKCSMDPNDTNGREAPMERWEELWVNMENGNSSDCPEIYQRYSTDHSYCKKSTCRIRSNGVTEEDKKFILKMHNDFRNKLALGNENQCKQLPPAANMMQMEWDDELARIAQAHANLCIYNYDSSEERQAENFDNVGQMIFSPSTCTSQSKIWNNIGSWYKKGVCFYSPDYIRPFRFGNDYGYFTQFTWANTWKVGCGFTSYKTNFRYYTLYVCNYGPMGNIQGTTHYMVGDPCSRCPKNTKCSKEFPGLCKSSTENGPQRTRRRSSDFLLFCEFSEDDSEACNDVIVTGSRNFTTKHIYIGDYKAVVLQGGESITIDFGKRRYSAGVCPFMYIKNGPNNAKDAFGSKLKVESTVEGGQTRSVVVAGSLYSGYIFPRTNIRTSSEVEIKFKLEVEEGAAPQYFDIQAWGIIKGPCWGFIYDDDF